jgi:hypothetical protein
MVVSGIFENIGFLNFWANVHGATICFGAAADGRWGKEVLGQRIAV